MKYVIIDIIVKENTSDGDILLVKANPVKDTMQELTDLFGTRYVQFSQTESDETETFAFPYSDENVKKFSDIAKASQNQESFWEPNDEFVDDAITDSSGEKIWVNKSLDLIPEYDMDDFIPLDDFLAHIGEEYDDDDYDEDDEDDEDFMYKEDLFDIDDSEEVEIYNSSIIDEEDSEDIFKDFYSNDAPSDYAISRKRYSEAEIKMMTVQERHERDVRPGHKPKGPLLPPSARKHGCTPVPAALWIQEGPGHERQMDRRSGAGGGGAEDLPAVPGGERRGVHSPHPPEGSGHDPPGILVQQGLEARREAVSHRPLSLEHEYSLEDSPSAGILR